jgi:L-threonylcarbamoyladenylate synthase
LNQQTPPLDAALIAHAVRVLRAGGLVALPTETVYGLAADATNEAAVRSIFAAKRRPADHPIIVHISGPVAIDDWTRDVPTAARRLAARFWPGPLTLVLKRGNKVLDVISGGQDTVGLRSPSHPWARAILRGFGGGLAAPSANSFGRISPTTAEHVRHDLGEKPHGSVDLIVDGGACPVGIESTIVDLSGAAPTLLRPGSVSRAAIEQELGVPLPDAEANAPRVSGRLEKHYAPRTPLEVVDANELVQRINRASAGECAVLAPAEVLQQLQSSPRLAIAAASNAADYARNLYAHLHLLDEAGARCILVCAPPADPAWLAVADRLQRAQGGP